MRLQLSDIGCRQESRELVYGGCLLQLCLDLLMSVCLRLPLRGIGMRRFLILRVRLSLLWSVAVGPGLHGPVHVKRSGDCRNLRLEILLGLSLV